MKKQSAYKWVRGLLQASAFTSVMFIMQACYGTPNYNREREMEEDIYETSVYGKIIDETSLQPLAGINISSDELGDAVVSDENGEFIITAYSYIQLDSIDLSFTDTAGHYASFDTLVSPECDSLNIKLSQIKA